MKLTFLAFLALTLVVMLGACAANNAAAPVPAAISTVVPMATETATATALPTATPAPAQQDTGQAVTLPEPTAISTPTWLFLTTPINLSSNKKGEIISVLDQLHPDICIQNGYDLVTLTPEPIEMHLPQLSFTEIAILPDPYPGYDNIRADNIDRSHTAFTGCKPGDCSKLYVTDNKTGKVYGVDFGATTDRPLDWLQWINKDTVTVTQQGHVWTVIAVINVEKQQFEYYGWIPVCFPTSTP